MCYARCNLQESNLFESDTAFVAVQHTIQHRTHTHITFYEVKNLSKERNSMILRRQKQKMEKYVKLSRVFFLLLNNNNVLVQLWIEIFHLIFGFWPKCTFLHASKLQCNSEYEWVAEQRNCKRNKRKQNKLLNYIESQLGSNRIKSISTTFDLVSDWIACFAESMHCRVVQLRWHRWRSMAQFVTNEMKAVISCETFALFLWIRNQSA